MSTTFVTMKKADIEKVVDTAKLDAPKLSKFATALLVKTFRGKKQYVDEIDESILFDMLESTVGQKLTYAFKMLPPPLTYVEILTNTSFFSSESKLFLKYESNGKKGQVELVADWKKIKKDVKDLNESLKDEAPQKLSYVQSLQHANIYPQIEAKLTPEAKKMFAGSSLALDIKITDKDTVDYLSKNRENLLLLQKASDAAGFAAIIGMCATSINMAAKQFPEGGDKATQFAQRNCEAALEDAVSRVMTVVANAAKIRYDRKIYQLKMTVKMIAGVVSTTLGAVSVAFGNPMGAAGIVKGVASIIGGIMDMAKDAAGAAKDLDEILETLEKRYRNDLGQIDMGSGGSEGVRQVLNVFVGGLTDTVPKAREKANLCKIKIDKMEIDSEEASKGINSALGEVKKLEGDKKTLDRLSVDPKYKSLAAKAEQAIDTAGKNVTKLLDDVIDLHKKAEAARKHYEGCLPVLEELEKAVPDAVKLAATFAKIANAAATLALAATELEGTFDIIKGSYEIAENSVEILHTLKESYEEIAKG